MTKSNKLTRTQIEQKWRKVVGKMRCSVHKMPPGVRAFDEDIYHQAYSKENVSVYLQGCCVPFMREVLNVLRKLPKKRNK